MKEQGILRFITCGSVDDGKSTLIGRLLFDSKAILADALDALAASSRKRGLDAVDLSLLTDGLSAEREQGITIDVAYRYFSTGTRKYILADTPGHEQYTRNMVTGASTAELAIVLIDARKGVLDQTRRHMTLAHIMGLRHVLVAINKMDLVDFKAEAFQRIVDQVNPFAAKLGIQDLRFIPLSALKGDMVVDRGANLNWYRGPTLLEVLEEIQVSQTDDEAPFRFPVQLVCRPRTPELLDYRGFQGRVESGQIRVGDSVRILPAGTRSHIKGIEFFGHSLSTASRGQSVTLHLKDEVDVSRGDLIACDRHPPEASREITASLCWLSEGPLNPSSRLLLRHGVREVRAKVHAILGRLDLHTLEPEPVRELRMNDIATVTLRTQSLIAPDTYQEVPGNGTFILIEEDSNATVGAGLVLSHPVF